MKHAVVVAALLAGCVTPPKPVPAPLPATPVAAPAGDEPLRAVTLRFLDAVEHRDFATAHTLLARPLRERYSVERLASDFSAEPLAVARLEKIRLSASAPFRLGDRAASLEWSPGRSLRLILDPEGWRITGIE